MRVDDRAGYYRFVPTKNLEISSASSSESVPSTRGLHSSNIRLNVSTYRGMRWVHGFPPAIRQGATGRCDQHGLE